MACLAHLSYLGDRHRGFAALVDALRLGRFDARLLALSDELALHLGHHAQHRHEDRSCGVLGREGRLQHPESSAFGLYGLETTEGQTSLPSPSPGPGWRSSRVAR